MNSNKCTYYLHSLYPGVPYQSDFGPAREYAFRRLSNNYTNQQINNHYNTIAIRNQERIDRRDGYDGYLMSPQPYPEDEPIYGLEGQYANTAAYRSVPEPLRYT